MIERTQRIPMRDLATMAVEDRAIVEKNAMGGQIFNIFKVLAHHPQLVKRWTPFAGRKVKGWPVGTFVRGRLAMWQGELGGAGGRPVRFGEALPRVTA